jgi:hypothetical protein
MPAPWASLQAACKVRAQAYATVVMRFYCCHFVSTHSNAVCREFEEGRRDGWLIEMVDVYCSSIICHDLLACSLSMRSHEPCKHKLGEFVFCLLIDVHITSWMSADVWSVCRCQLCPDFLPVGREIWVSQHAWFGCAVHPVTGDVWMYSGRAPDNMKYNTNHYP